VSDRPEAEPLSLLDLQRLAGGVEHIELAFRTATMGIQVMPHGHVAARIRRDDFQFIEDNAIPPET
jgi:hypothetical protein